MSGESFGGVRPPEWLTKWTTGLWSLAVVKGVGIHEAKTQFSKLLRLAEAGEEIVVRRGPQPVACIAPLSGRGRVHGFASLKGKIRIGEDFDEPLEDFGTTCSPGAG